MLYNDIGVGYFLLRRGPWLVSNALPALSRPSRCT